VLTLYWPFSSRCGGPECPFRYRDPHGEQSVLGPAGPGDFPPESSCVQSHHVHRHAPATPIRLVFFTPRKSLSLKLSDT